MEKQFKPVPDVECLKYHGTPEKPDIKIFVSHRIDLDSETIDNPLYIPVRCGAVYDERENVEMLGDDSGDNISEKRMSFCELTVQYWAWKNVKADYYGLCHYRRFLSFSDKKYSTTSEGCIEEKFINDDLINKYNLKSEPMTDEITKYDIIVSSSIDIDTLNDAPHKSYYELCKKRDIDFNIFDVDKLISIVKRRYPSFSDDVDKYFNSKAILFYNCFIMKKEAFFSYNEWLFNVLFEFEKGLDTSYYTAPQIRIPAFMSEALLGIYLLHMKRVSNISIQEHQVVFIEKPNRIEYYHPAFSENNIPIVMISSDFFSPYTATALQSIVVNSSTKSNYDFIILTEDMSTQNKNKIKKLMLAYDNFSVRFFDPSVVLYRYKSKLTVESRLNVITFYRIALPYILPYYDKVICIDSDLVFEVDISQLYSIDIGKNYIGAVRDVFIQGFMKGFSKEFMEYCENDYPLKNKNNYVNTGVVIFNLDELRKNFSFKEIMEISTAQRYFFQEQDVLNLIAENHLYLLDERWNMTAYDNPTALWNLKYAPHIYAENYLKARECPFVVHYAGGTKPWQVSDVDFAERFWYYARQSPYYEVVLHRLMWDVRNYYPPQIQSPWESHARKISNKIIPQGTKRREFAKKILPKGSRRWNFFKKIYYFFFRKG